MVPIEIGQPYTFDFTATATARDDDFDDPSGSFSGTLSYEIVDAPEPSAWMLMLSGAALLFFITGRKFRPA
jgi:hypothetical protein